MKKTNKAELTITSCIFVWILIVNIIAGALGLVSWPMFFVTIFFFTMGADPKNIPSIFIGGTIGLAFAYLLALGLDKLTPIIGLYATFLPLITIVLGVIIIGGTVWPVGFNNIAFAYLTVAAINIFELKLSDILNNLVMLYVGGGIILGGVVLMNMLGGKLVAKQEAKQKAEEKAE